LVLIVASGDDRVAFIADNVLGEQDMVIKPLPFPLRRVPRVAGAALRGNGEVLPVLAPADLVLAASVTARASSHSPPASRPRRELPRVAGRLVLVVDDALTTRTLEKAILEHAGYRVTSARSGSEAWDILQRTTVDVVVTDVDMPEMDGFDLLQRVRQHQSLSSLPVVLVTSLSSAAERARGMELGASAYIAKGQFDQEQFLDVLATVI
jgi:CheY-like chemotaxis protein